MCVCHNARVIFHSRKSASGCGCVCVCVQLYLRCSCCVTCEGLSISDSLSLLLCSLSISFHSAKCIRQNAQKVFFFCMEGQGSQELQETILFKVADQNLIAYFFRWHLSVIFCSFRIWATLYADNTKKCQPKHIEISTGILFIQNMRNFLGK